MYDEAVQAADRILSGTLHDLERLYPAAISPLMERYKATFDKLAKLEKDGAYGRARVLIRQSGLLDDFARAIASAGRDAADLIRAEISGIKEVARNDDTPAAE